MSESSSTCTCPTEEMDFDVTILVGPEEQAYVLRKSHLTQSDYFRVAFTGNFLEAENRIMCLPEEDPEVFDLFVAYLKDGIIPVVRQGGLFNVLFSNPSSSFGSTSLNVLEPDDPTEASRPPSQPPTLPPLIPVCFGTRRYPYEESEYDSEDSPVVETSSDVDIPLAGHANIASEYDRHTNICSRDSFRRWSPEELRWADYQNIEGSRSAVRTSSRIVPFGKPGPIPGIPKGPSVAEQAEEDEKYQLNVLGLCIFAEIICWPGLFNAAMTAYAKGEVSLSHRDLPSEHIQLIYQRTHEKSNCRRFAADLVVSQLHKRSSNELYVELAQEYPEFLSDIFDSVAKHPVITLRNPLKVPPCVYHMHPKEQRCPEWDDWVNGSGRIELFYTRSWLAYQEERRADMRSGIRRQPRF